MQRGGVTCELQCAACGERQRCGPTQMSQQLAGIGMLKRSAAPDLALLQELFHQAADRLPCPNCRAVGLTIVASSDLTDDDSWDEARRCDGCRQPISAERLAIFPDTTRCPTCQASNERGADQEREFCDHCGAILTMRLRRSAGPAAYQMHCPDCGK